jgi:hypothetical protein
VVAGAAVPTMEDRFLNHPVLVDPELAHARIVGVR